MAGVRGRLPSSAPPPRGARVYVGRRSLSVMLPTPHSTKQKEKPPPPGATPTPTWAVHSVVFSSPMAQGGGGEVARQSRSLSWTVAVTGSTGHSGTHSLCHLFFGSAQIYQSHHPIRNIPPNRKLKPGSSVSPSGSHVCFPGCLLCSPRSGSFAGTSGCPQGPRVNRPFTKVLIT